MGLHNLARWAVGSMTHISAHRLAHSDVAALQSPRTRSTLADSLWIYRLYIECRTPPLSLPQCGLVITKDTTRLSLLVLQCICL